jgi:pyruvate dehydrogenase E1 component alpha subunit
MIEEKIIELYPKDLIQSPVHLSIGQEAVAVGVCTALGEKDLIFINYRGHAYYLARGGDLRKFFAELFGKVTGISKGKAGSMHLAYPQNGVMGASAVVASSISNAVGAAFASKILNKNQVIATIFGDGATEQGSFHESLNFASLKKLPILFICEDNGYAVHTSLKNRQSYSLSSIANTYFINTHCVIDGYDPLRTQQVVLNAIKNIKDGLGPQFLLIKTARYLEHVGINEDFSAGYRSEDDLKEWKKNDPILNMEKNEELLKKINFEIQDAVSYAIESSFPARSELLKDVY